MYRASIRHVFLLFLVAISGCSCSSEKMSPSGKTAGKGVGETTSGRPVRLIPFSAEEQQLVDGGAARWEEELPASNFDNEPKNPSDRVDLRGDPLPVGAMARVGTWRLRQKTQLSPVAFSADDRLLATAPSDTRDTKVVFWDVTTGKRIPYRGDMLTSDGKYLLSWKPENYRFSFRDVTSGKMTREIRLRGGSDGGIGEVNLSPDGKILVVTGYISRETGYFIQECGAYYTYAHDGTIGLWNAESGVGLFKGKLIDEVIHRTAFSPDSKMLAAATGKQTVRVWDTTTGEVLHTFSGRHSHVTFVSFSPDGRLLFSCGFDSSICLWDVTTGKELGTLVSKNSQLGRRPIFSPDSKRIAWTEEKDILVYEIATLREVQALRNHQGVVWGIAFSPDGKCLASASQDGTVRFWDAATGAEIKKIDDLINTGAVIFSRNGKLLAWSRGTSIRIWDLGADKELLDDPSRDVSIFALALSPDGKTLATGSFSKLEIRLWEAATGKELGTLPGDKEWVEILAFSPNGKILASSSRNQKKIHLWDWAAGKKIRQIESYKTYVSALAFSPDSSRLASGSIPGTGRREFNVSVRLWDIATGEELWEDSDLISASNRANRTSLDFLLYRLRCMGFSSDGKILAGICDQPRSCEGYFWDAVTGKKLSFPVAEVSQCTFSPNESFMSYEADKKIHVLDLSTKKDVFAIDGRTAGFGGVAFTSILATNTAQEVMLWNAKTGQFLGKVSGHTGTIRGKALSKNGKVMVTSSEDGTFLVWDLSGYVHEKRKDR